MSKALELVTPLAVASIGLALIVTGLSTHAQTATVPNFEMDPLFFQNLPNQWTTGQWAA